MDRPNSLGKSDSALTLSFELYPPKDLNHRGFWRCTGALDVRKPAFLSLTHGALGSDTTSNFELIQQLVNESSSPIAAHLTCLGRQPEAVKH
ncbi:MAG: methylenetetrahydrofolate reductase, partial [Gammaproteobacteria bacterium]|nr:methylenetetrahydrofolate reductase [Gammaproteobacteria bacterium]